jgi:lipopolysaccharide transport system ATP-binding protein
MSAIAASVEGLSKRYRLGEREPYKTLRDVLASAAYMPFRSRSGEMDGQRAKRGQWIWALKDVSFEVHRGDAVGIIGRNGAGKSTLLKILSRVTEPTDGEVKLYGRVGALLEAGTGFHPELTGRENVFLNGAVLGMARAEIKRRFDDIVDFAEIGRFIDTPVKRYSSGMYLRLAFSVAAHLEPEILVVDEVLAVGDLAFQRKCLGKMGDVAREGRTVLFVSHNMAVVQSLCRSAVLLKDGVVRMQGTTGDTVAAYLRTLEQAAQDDLLARTDRGGRGTVALAKVQVCTRDGQPSGSLTTGWPARFVFHLTAAPLGLSIGLTIYDQFGQPVTHLSSYTRGPEDACDPALGSAVLCDLDELLLAPGRYRIDVEVETNAQLQDFVEGAAFFDVEESDVRGRAFHGGGGTNYGSVIFPHRWTLPMTRNE